MKNKLMNLMRALIIILFLSACTKNIDNTKGSATEDIKAQTEFIKTDEDLALEVFDEYYSYLNYKSLEERLTNLKVEKPLTVGYAEKSLEVKIDFVEKLLNFKKEYNQLCQELNSITKNQLKESCDKLLSSFEQMREVELLSRNIAKSNLSTVFVPVKFKQTFVYSNNRTVLEGNNTFILHRVGDNWKIADYILKDGILESKTSSLTIEQTDNARIIRELSEDLDLRRKVLEDYKTEVKKLNEYLEKGYPQGMEVKVDYLAYNVTKVETFSEMGTSFLSKKTDGKFVKAYIRITNKAKETKEIFTPRFKLIDSLGRKFDRLSDDMFYISDALKFGQQLQPDLPLSGAIVFEVPKDSDKLVLSVIGDWVSSSEIKIVLSNTKEIGRDTTQKQEQDKMMDEIMSQSKEQAEEYLKQFGLE